MCAGDERAAQSMRHPAPCLRKGQLSPLMGCTCSPRPPCLQGPSEHLQELRARALRGMLRRPRRHTLCFSTGLDWTKPDLDWAGLDWAGLNLTRLDWTGLDWVLTLSSNPNVEP